jgi:hypothetical protein
MVKTRKNTENEALIDDSGIIKNHKIRRSRIFIALCQLISIGLICLGILALINK